MIMAMAATIKSMTLSVINGDGRDKNMNTFVSF